jgi:hypothetical protein
MIPASSKCLNGDTGITPAEQEVFMEQKSKKEDMPDPNQEVCRLMQAQLECHMAEFNPRQLKALEDSGQLQEFLEERSSQARLVTSWTSGDIQGAKVPSHSPLELQ